MAIFDERGGLMAWRWGRRDLAGVGNVVES
jgi:hypothetical protein